MDEKNENKNEIKLEEKEEKPKLKVIISGNKGVGKSAIKSIIFNNFEPKDTFNLASADEIQETHINYINNIFIDVLELSSNPEEKKQYFTTKKEYIFSNVAIFIFVSDSQEQKNDDIKYFEDSTKALLDLSPKAKINVLINKMDTIADSLRNSVFNDKKSSFEKKVQNGGLKFYQTSIWELNIYKIFCDIFSETINYSGKIKKFLENYLLNIDAEEVFLYNKKTSLFISSFTKKAIKDEKRFEKICFSLKKITNRLKNPERRFKEMIINNKTNTIYLAEFNEFCYIIVILAKNKNLELAKLNIDIGKKIFEKEINNIN